jgi:thiol-disulfide isomerase/thioredoxin
VDTVDGFSNRNNTALGGLMKTTRRRIDFKSEIEQMKCVFNDGVFMRLIILFILTFFSFLPAVAQSGGIITAKSGPPIMLGDEGGYNFGLNEQKFMELSRKISAMNPDFVGIKQKPAKLTAAALFGFNLVIGQKNLSWILDRDAKNDYVLYADFNADGDLSNDKPLNFKKIDGKYVAEVHKILTETINKQRRKYSYDLRLEVAEEPSRDKTEKETVLKVQGGTMRRGSFSLNDRQIAFALVGYNGIYDYEAYKLYFDLDGDKKFDSETLYSPEVFLVNEKYINIGDRSYEFKIDRYGNSLILKPLDKKLPERADLRVGSVAPDFSFKDLDGNPRRLSDFRGKIVLLDVWALWCAPCVREAPKLSAAYKKLKEKNFEIVSLNKNDPLESLQNFIAENQMNWTHAATDEAFLNLYRVVQYPTYFLLDKDGKIISNTLRPGEEMYKKVEEMASF